MNAVKNMNILFLSLGKLENIKEPGIYTDLLRTFRDKGHNVFVMSAREKKYNLPTKLEEIDGITNLKIRTGNFKKVNLIEKGITTLMLEMTYLKAFKEQFSDVKFDLILYTTPPITFTNLIKFVKKRDKAKSYLLLKDIFPQNAIDLGMFTKKNPVYSYFRYKEKQLYKHSDVIGCMSEANVRYIIRENPEVNKEKVEVCPNTITPIDITVDNKIVNKVRKKHKIPISKTIFIYGGNLGKPQGIDFLIRCLKENEKNTNSYILIVGTGTEYKKLANFFSKEKPSNAKLISQLPKDDYEALANTCDVGLIFLDYRFKIPNFPSRILSYMQASLPVLVATDSNTDIGEVVESNDFGYYSPSNNVKTFNTQLLKLTNESVRHRMGIQSRKYLEENFTSKDTYDIIIKHFK